MKYLYLNFWLDVGFLQVSTEIMNRRMESRTIEWLAVRVTSFGKGFSFRLFERPRL